MTITANPVRNQYIAAPNQTVFNYTYKIYSDNDLSVYVTPAGQAPDDSADLITSYTVDPGTIGNQSGGFITLDTGANSGDIITIASAIQYDRETDYQTNGDFSPETVNGDIDRVVSLVKQNKGLINRAVLAPASGGGEDEPISFPIPDDQKGLKWESGNLANTPIVEGVTTDSNEFGLVSTTGNEVKIRGLKSGQNVTLTDDGTDILIKAEVQGGQGDVSSSSSNTYAPGTTQAFDAATLKGKNLEELAGNRVSRFFDGSLTSGDNTIYDFSDFDLLDWVDVSITLSAFSSSGQGDPQLIVLCDRLEGDGAVKNSTSSDYSIKQSSTVISTVHDVKIGTSNGTSIFATELTPPVAFLEGQRALLTINTTLQKYHANQIIKITLSSASQAQVKYSLTAKRSQALEI